MPQPRVDNRSTGSILAGAYGALTRVFGGLWSRYGGWGWSRIRLFLPSARFDWEREAADAWMNSVVALAIAWLGDRFPRPLIRIAKIARNGDHVPVGRHALTDLWQKPNRFYGRRTLEKAIGLSLKVDGNAYIYKVRSGRGDVVELWWVPHYRILPTWPSDGSAYIDGYRVWLDTAVYHLPPQDVIHIRDGIDPRNERLGLSALRANLREVCTLNFEAGYTAGLLKNSGVPGVMIVPDDAGGAPPRPDKDAADRIKERFVESFSGDRTGEPVVMAGRYKIVEVGFSPEKLVLDRLPRTAEARVAASVGVAAMSVGLPDANKTYSNLGEANKTSWGTVIAVQELVAEALRDQLLIEPIVTRSSSSPGVDPAQYVVEYDYGGILELQESLDSLHARSREDFKAGGITRNEFREETGREPIPDGDVFFEQIQQGTEQGEIETEPGPSGTAVGDDAGPIKSAGRNGVLTANGAHPRWTY